MNFLKRLLTSYLFLLLLNMAAAFALGYLVRDRGWLPGSGFPVLQQAYQILDRHALNDLPEQPALEYGMIRGMLQAYGDPYTSFMEPAQHELRSDSLQGSFGGIGVVLQKDAQSLWVLYPVDGGPAALAGVLEGDYLIAVENSLITAETPTEEIQAAVRGPVGSRVRITVTRADTPEPLEFRIERGEIAIPSTTWHIEPSEPRLGVVEINLVAASTPTEVQQAFEDLLARGATHFVIDLRNNGGGLLDAGIQTANLFLDAGDIIQRQYRDQDIDTFSVEKPGPFLDVPLAILVNEYTASASEIIAGSLQAHGRAALIGTPTYGKNTIQLVFDLQDDSSLSVTAAQWWIPNLDFPAGEVGLLPDRPLPPDAAPEAGVQSAVALFFEGE